MCPACGDETARTGDFEARIRKTEILNLVLHDNFRTVCVVLDQVSFPTRTCWMCAADPTRWCGWRFPSQLGLPELVAGRRRGPKTGNRLEGRADPVDEDAAEPAKEAARRP